MDNLIVQEIEQVSVQEYVINNAEDLVRINAVLKGVKQLQKKVKEELDPVIERAHQSHKEATSLRNKYLDLTALKSEHSFMY